MKSGTRLGAFSSSWTIMRLAFLAAVMITGTTGEWWTWLPVLAAGSSLCGFCV